MYVNTAWSRGFWREVERIEQSRHRQGGKCFHQLRDHTNPEYDARCGAYEDPRSITFTARYDSPPPAEAIWHDVVYNTHIADQSGLRIFEACCALFDLRNTDGFDKDGNRADGCYKVYARGELLRICDSRAQFLDRMKKDASCDTARPALGQPVCESFEAFKNRPGFHKTLARDIRYSHVEEVSQLGLRSG